VPTRIVDVMLGMILARASGCEVSKTMEELA